jgi:hypothetical protein
MMFTLPQHPLIEKLKQLDLPAKDFAIFGSGPLWVRGIRTSKDLDIIARGAAWEKAKKLGTVGINDRDGTEKVTLANGQIEVYQSWYPGEWNIDALIDSTDSVEGLPFVKLEHVLEWKQRLGREKDVRDVALITEFLANHPRK